MSKTCTCVNHHSPAVLEYHRHSIAPDSWGCDGENPVVLLCPTSHINAHKLLDLYIECGGKPHGFLLRDFNHQIRAYAEQAWERKTKEPVASSIDECLTWLGVKNAAAV